MKVGIVILNYKDQKDTLSCLNSLLKVDRKDLDLKTYLVDNKSSQDLSIEEKEYKDINLEIIRNEINLGFSGGNNLGIEKALSNDCEFVLIMNNDTTVDPEFLLELLKAFENKEMGIASPKIYFSKGKEFHHDRYSKDELGKVIWYAGGILDLKNILSSHRGVDEVDSGQFNKKEETDFATGCAMLVRKEVFEKIGMLDEKYFLYLEDLDFSIRAKKAGFRIKFVPKAVIWHENAGSAGGSGSEIQDYYFSRNRLIFGNKYAGVRARAALTRESLRLALSGRPMQKLGIRDYYLRKFGRGSMDL